MPKLTLVPTKAAVDRKLAGFHQGKPLSLNFSKGETLDTVMHRFNEYRSPDNQIEKLVTSANHPIPFATVLGSEDFQAYVL
jgi:hypothetical protein